MAITVADLGGANISGITTTATVTLTTSTTASVGDYIIVAVGSSTTQRTLSSVTDSAGNTYAVDVTSNDASTAENVYIASGHCTSQLNSGGTITATFASSLSSVRSISAARATNIASGTALDVTATNKGTSAGWSATAAGNTAQANELLIGAAFFGTVASNTPGVTKAGNGHTYNEIVDINGNSRTHLMEYYEETAVDTYRSAGSWSASAQPWKAAFATYKISTATPIDLNGNGLSHTRAIGTPYLVPLPPGQAHTRGISSPKVNDKLFWTGIAHTRGITGPNVTKGLTVNLSGMGLDRSVPEFPPLFDPPRTLGRSAVVQGIVPAGQVHSRALGAVVVSPTIVTSGQAHTRSLGTGIKVNPQIRVTGFAHGRALGFPGVGVPGGSFPASASRRKRFAVEVAPGLENILAPRTLG